jgi:hypothetical protein
MRVYKIEYHEYGWQFSGARDCNDWVLTPAIGKYVMADNSLDAVDLLRSSLSNRRIEIASIEHVCKVDIKK